MKNVQKSLCHLHYSWEDLVHEVYLQSSYAVKGFRMSMPMRWYWERTSRCCWPGCCRMPIRRCLTVCRAL